MLLRFSSAYHSKTLSVPAKWLADLLLYDDVQLFISDCKYYKIDVNSESKEIKFNKFDFDQKKNVVSLSFIFPSGHFSSRVEVVDGTSVFEKMSIALFISRLILNSLKLIVMLRSLHLS